MVQRYLDSDAEFGGQYVIPSSRGVIRRFRGSAIGRARCGRRSTSLCILACATPA